MVCIPVSTMYLACLPYRRRDDMRARLCITAEYLCRPQSNRLMTIQRRSFVACSGWLDTFCGPAYLTLHLRSLAEGDVSPALVLG